MPRAKDPIWDHFNCINKPGNTGNWAQCKKCKSEFQGIASRLRSHFETCSTALADPDNAAGAGPAPAVASTSTASSVPQKRTGFTSSQSSAAKKTKPSLTVTADSAIIQTSSKYKEKIDRQLAQYFYATNTPFNHADHPQFIRLCEVLRPGYKPPSARNLAGPLLDSTYSSMLESCKAQFEGETVTMGLDGWSNVHNEPIVCLTITNGNGQHALVSTVDTSGNSHTSEYLQTLAKQEIKKCEDEFKVRVGAFVTDNTGNVRKMRRELQKDDELEIIQFGCSAHLLNLLAKDVAVKSVAAHIIKIIKYFRNTHLPAAWYKAANGKKLIIPCEVRWNTMSRAISSYLNNRGILVQICQDHKAEIDKQVLKLVNDGNLAANAQDFAARMRPIAVALDRMQRDQTVISVGVEIWHALEKALEDQPATVKSALQKRRDTALGPVHYLANMMDHRFKGQHLTEAQKASAYEYLKGVDKDLLPLLLCHTTGSPPFPKHLYAKEFREVSPLAWWKSVSFDDPKAMKWNEKSETWLKLCEQVFSAVPSTAVVERTFSSFGLVQSKLRNRLGNEKAGKLTFMFKHMNQKPPDQKQNNLNFAWNPEDEPQDEDDEEESEADPDSDIEIVEELEDNPEEIQPEGADESDSE